MTHRVRNTLPAYAREHARIEERHQFTKRKIQINKNKLKDKDGLKIN